MCFSDFWPFQDMYLTTTGTIRDSPLHPIFDELQVFRSIHFISLVLKCAQTLWIKRIWAVALAVVMVWSQNYSGVFSWMYQQWFLSYGYKYQKLVPIVCKLNLKLVHNIIIYCDGQTVTCARAKKAKKIAAVNVHVTVYSQNQIRYYFIIVWLTVFELRS